MSKKRITKPAKQNEDSSLRPIGARALKSAIDTLRPELAGAAILDLFAGQGRFGIAAAKEGIASVTFVEKNPKTAAMLKTACMAKSFPTGVPWKVHSQDAFQYLETTLLKYDLVFADPPFPDWNLSFESKLLLAVAPVLTPSGIFLVKHPARVVASTEIEGLRLWKQTEFGESNLLYFEKVNGKGE